MFPRCGDDLGYLGMSSDMASGMSLETQIFKVAE